MVYALRERHDSSYRYAREGESVFTPLGSCFSCRMSDLKSTIDTPETPCPRRTLSRQTFSALSRNMISTEFPFLAFSTDNATICRSARSTACSGFPALSAMHTLTLSTMVDTRLSA